MSQQYSPEIEFTHYDDCNSRGCRGHRLQAICTTSGYLAFKRDGETAEYGSTFDPHEFEAMTKAVAQID